MSNADTLTFDAVQLAGAPDAHQPPTEKMIVAVVALLVPVVLFLAAVIFAPSFLVIYGSIAATTYVLGMFVMCVGIMFPSRKPG